MTIKNIFLRTASIVPIEVLKKTSFFDVLLPYHHTISDRHLPHINNLYPNKNVRQFKNDLEFLLKYFKPIHPDNLLDSVQNNKPLPKNHFLLTFDDGYKEIYQVIAPILESKGVPAIFFINPGFIDNHKLFTRCKVSLLIELLNQDNLLALQYSKNLDFQSKNINNLIYHLKEFKINEDLKLDNLAKDIGFSFDSYLKAERPFLTTSELISLNKRGFTIGGHSMTHPYYQLLSKEQQLAETLNSCRKVSEITGQKYSYFSFPFQENNLEQSLFDDLLNSELDLMFGLQNQKDEIRNKMFHRFNAERPKIRFDHQVKAILLLSLINKIFGKHVVKRL